MEEGIDCLFYTINDIHCAVCYINIMKSNSVLYT